MHVYPVVLNTFLHDETKQRHDIDGEGSVAHRGLGDGREDTEDAEAACEALHVVARVRASSPTLAWKEETRRRLGQHLGDDGFLSNLRRNEGEFTSSIERVNESGEGKRRRRPASSTASSSTRDELGSVSTCKERRRGMASPLGI
jgi:hypothetical protein